MNRSMTIEPEFRTDEKCEPSRGWVKIDGEWHNIILVVDGDTDELKIYIDGIRASTIPNIKVESLEQGEGVHNAKFG
jgi:hypothetical protein